MAIKRRGNHTFTSPGVSPIYPIKDVEAIAEFGLQVDVNGTISAWEVELQGSINGISYKKLMSHKSGILNDDDINWLTSPRVVDYVRFELLSMTGVGDVKCYWLGRSS